jgi:hypothetical protein
MEAKARLVAAIVMSILSCGAHAGGDTGYDKQLARLEDSKTLQAWRMYASAGDAEKQERLAELLLDPRAPARKASRLEGAHFLLQAATSGRTKSMLKLADALNKGGFGFKKLPDAARCWSGTPTDFETRLACLGLTDFRDPRARVPCNDLTSMREGLPPGRTTGATMARLCLANKTPALLIPGPPPGKDAIERGHLYAQYGIEWVITGDVYEDEFEKYRYEFNKTVVADIEAKRGRGYMEKLSNDIETRMSRRHRGRK